MSIKTPQSISFSLLALSFVAGISAWAQENIQEVPRVQQAPSALLNSTPSSTQPVIVNNGMSPQVIPQAQVPQTQIQHVPPSSIPQNGNLGGVQQIVSVQANPTSSAEAAQSSGTSRADLLRRQRLRVEQDNESLLVEKLEEGRMSDEEKRLRDIEKFRANLGVRESKIESSNTTATTAIAENGSTATATTTIVAPVKIVNPPISENEQEVQVERSGMLGLGGAFVLSPLVGYRWYSCGGIMGARNIITTGLSLDGRINNYFSIVGSFIYSKDSFNAYGDPYGNSSFVGYGSGNSYGISGGSRDNFEVGAAAKVGPWMGRFKPYASAGLAGIFRKYNVISSCDANCLSSNYGLMNATNHLAGNFGLGADISLSRNFSVGAQFSYQTLFNHDDSIMNVLYGDSSNSYGLLGNLSLVF